MPSIRDRRLRPNRLLLCACAAIVAVGARDRDRARARPREEARRPGGLPGRGRGGRQRRRSRSRAARGGALLIPFLYYFLAPSEAFSVRSSQIVSLVVLGLGEVLVAWIVAREQKARALSADAREVNEALDRAGMAMWEWDVERDRVRWSDAVRGHHGFGRSSRPETFDQLLAWIHPEDRERFRAAVADALAAKSEFEVDVRTSMTARGWSWVQLQGGIRGLRGKRVAGLTRDVTSRRRSVERERFLGGLTRALAVAPDYEGMLVGARATRRSRARRLVLDRRRRGGREHPQRRHAAHRPGQG